MTSEAFTELLDLASDRVGGAAVWCTDEFFAEKDNLTKAQPAVWREEAYTDRGKWMDGWESRRRFGRRDGHDTCIVRLGAPGIVRGVVVDTAFFRGNFPEACAIDGACIDGHPSESALLDPRVDWFPLVARTPLQGNHANVIAVESPYRVTHVRLHIFPDGGVARLRVYGEALCDWRTAGGLDGEVDLAAAEHGGLVVACTDMFFGSRHNLIFPGLGGGMHDGWETRRRRAEGHDHAVVKLGAQGRITRVVVDTRHFKGNSPDRFALEGGPTADGPWTPVLPETKLQPHTQHTYFEGLLSTDAFAFARFHIFPDGGVSRLRLFGRVSGEGKRAARLAALNAEAPARSERTMTSLCGSSVFAHVVAAARPFADEGALRAAIDAAWKKLAEGDWLEAFRAHPRLGDKKAADSANAQSRAWSSGEQAKIASADDAQATRLADANGAYEAKFEHVFLLCATGRSASDVEAALAVRMKNDADTELRVAADEQKKITALRLEKMLAGG